MKRTDFVKLVKWVLIENDLDIIRSGLFGQGFEFVSIDSFVDQVHYQMNNPDLKEILENVKLPREK